MQLLPELAERLAENFRKAGFERVTGDYLVELAAKPVKEREVDIVGRMMDQLLTDNGIDIT